MENNMLNLVNKESNEKFQESCWKNYSRIIDKFLLCLKDIKSCKFDEIENIRILSKFELEKKLKQSSEKLGPINFVTRNLINDIKNMEKYHKNLINSKENLSKIIEKLENQIFEFLKNFQNVFKMSKDDDEIKDSFENKLFQAFKIFSNIFV